MIDTTETPISAPRAIQTSAGSVTLAVALMSFAALLLELGLTRLFSVVLFYHFAFLAISIALAWSGRRRGVRLPAARVAGAVVGQPAWARRSVPPTRCVIFAVLEVVLHTAVSLHLDWPNFWRLTVLYLVAAVPFFVTGLLFSVVFARHPERITQLYGADLLGGSLACLALVPLLNFFGGPNTIVFAAVVVALAGVVWAAPGKRLAPACLDCGFAAADRHQLPQQAGRHCLCQGHEAQSRCTRAGTRSRGSRSTSRAGPRPSSSTPMPAPT